MNQGDLERVPLIGAGKICPPASIGAFEVGFWHKADVSRWGLSCPLLEVKRTLAKLTSDWRSKSVTTSIPIVFNNVQAILSGPARLHDVEGGGEEYAGR
jgi:hypothetical protein